MKNEKTQQAERLKAFFERTEMKMFAKAASIYTTSELDVDNMSNLDALGFVLVRAALCKQYVANERHAQALTYGATELAKQLEAEVVAQRNKVESLWKGLAARGHEFPQAWRA